MILTEHNNYRALHGVAPLTWDPVLAAACQQYANANCNVKNTKCQHGHDSSLINTGENLFWAGESGGIVDATSYATTAVKAWYDEIKDYDYIKPGFSSQTGHFTQVVWDNTTRVGGAYALSPDKQYITIVCRYTPAGNFYGEYEANVPPLMESFTSHIGEQGSLRSCSVGFDISEGYTLADRMKNAAQRAAAAKKQELSGQTRAITLNKDLDPKDKARQLKAISKSIRKSARKAACDVHRYEIPACPFDSDKKMKKRINAVMQMIAWGSIKP
jgi:hypothetical protein